MIGNPYYGLTLEQIDAHLVNARTALDNALQASGYTISSGRLSRSKENPEIRAINETIFWLTQAREYRLRGGKNITHTHVKMVQ